MAIYNYLNNEKLKARGVKLNFTPEQLEEIIKCKNDIPYFANNYVHIITLDYGLQKIKLRDYQEKSLDIYSKERFVVTLASRQSAKTTTAMVYALHAVLFNSHYNVVILGNKGSTAREILDRIKIAYEELPKWLQQGVLEWNKGSIKLENGSKIFTGPTTVSSVRSKSLNCVSSESKVTVRNKETGEIKTLSIKELGELLQ